MILLGKKIFMGYLWNTPYVWKFISSNFLISKRFKDFFNNLMKIIWPRIYYFVWNQQKFIYPYVTTSAKRFTVEFFSKGFGDFSKKIANPKLFKNVRKYDFYIFAFSRNLTVNFQIFQVRPGEPVYAQVNRDKKKNSRNHSDHPQMLMQYGDYSEHADHWQQQPPPQQQQPQQQHPQHIHGPAATPAGDSWVWWKQFFRENNFSVKLKPEKAKIIRLPFAWCLLLFFWRILLPYQFFPTRIYIDYLSFKYCFLKRQKHNTITMKITSLNRLWRFKKVLLAILLKLLMKIGRKKLLKCWSTK